MKIDFLFPWTQDEFVKLKLYFAHEDKIEMEWWWQPFHQVGFQALRLSAQKKVSLQTLETQLSQLSSPVTPGDLQTLDPEISIRATMNSAAASKEVAAKFEKFGHAHAILPKIDELAHLLGDKKDLWKPTLASYDEATLSSWLTKDLRLMKRFQALNPWEQLTLAEGLLGVAKSSSILHFQRIGAK